MPGPLVVVVFIATADVGTPATEAMVAATRDSLGGAVVLVETSHPTDEQATRIGEKVHADAVAEVTWSLDRERAHLHIHFGTGWADRDLAFKPSDDAAQRGRAVGLAIAVMVPSSEPMTIPPPAPPPTPPAPPTPSVPAPTASTPTPAPTRVRLDIGVAAIGALGASGFGFELGAVLRPGSTWSLRAGAGARFGSLEAANGRQSTTRYSLGAGIGVARSGRLALDLGVDALALRHEVERENPGTPERTRWIGGFDVVGDLSFGVNDSVALFGESGVEVAFGETAVLVGSERVATIPRARWISLLGLRLRF